MSAALLFLASKGHRVLYGFVSCWLEVCSDAKEDIADMGSGHHIQMLVAQGAGIQAAQRHFTQCFFLFLFGCRVNLQLGAELPVTLSQFCRVVSCEWTSCIIRL